MNKFFVLVPLMWLALLPAWAADPMAAAHVPTAASLVIEADGSALSGVLTKLTGNFTPDDLRGNWLLFASPGDNYAAGAVFHSQNGQAGRTFRTVLALLKKHKARLIDKTVGTTRIVDFYLDGERGMCILYYGDLALFSTNYAGADTIHPNIITPLAAQLDRGDSAAAGILKFPNEAGTGFDTLPKCWRKLEAARLRLSGSGTELEIEFSFADTTSVTQFREQLSTLLPEAKIRTEGPVLTLRGNSILSRALTERCPVVHAEFQRRQSVRQLKQLHTCIRLWLDERSNRYFTSLSEFNSVMQPGGKLFLAPFDRTPGRSSKSFAAISYAYVATGVSVDELNQPASVPVLFEKPDRVPDDRIAVLYADGHVGWFRLPHTLSRTCIAVVKALRNDKAASASVWQQLEKNARTLDPKQQ